MQFKIIAAVEDNYGIGIDNRLPWSFKKDLKHFSTTTKQAHVKQVHVKQAHVKQASVPKKNAIVMGRKTWESIPGKMLPGRDNLVLTRSTRSTLSPNDPNPPTVGEYNDLFFFNSFEAIHEFCLQQDYDTVWIIGGSSIYNYYIKQSYINELVITKINASYVCDTVFPKIPREFLKARITMMTDVDRITNNPTTLSFEYYLILEFFFVHN